MLRVVKPIRVVHFVVCNCPTFSHGDTISTLWVKVALHVNVKEKKITSSVSTSFHQQRDLFHFDLMVIHKNLLLQGWTKVKELLKKVEQVLWSVEKYGALQCGSVGGGGCYGCCRGGGERKSNAGEGRESSEAQGRGRRNRTSDAVFLVPHMGVGQRIAQQGLEVTLSSSRPGILLAALHRPATPTGLFWLLKGRV